MTQARVDTDASDLAQTMTASDAGVHKLRNRLLDLTSRNPLLNYRHPRASSLRIVDELPDVLFRSLVGGRSMRFTPVRKPNPNFTDVREAARLQQISIGYELPSAAQSLTTTGGAKHLDSEIQVLLFPKDLEDRLRKIRRSARTAIEESGVNVLYLALGFLEWFESDSSDQARLAPLVLVPVELSPLEFVPEFGSQSSSLTYTDDDLNPNVTLFEKVRRDFGITLPDLPENIAAADFTLENYLTNVANAVHGLQRWCVRRYVSLGFFQFANIYLWKDLARTEDVLERPLVQRFFEGRQAAEPVVSTDAIEQLDERTTTTPLVYDADSSQHAVIESVAAGCNLLVEGPPGTGKSQTIANIIGACLAAGKSVLFVSEKLAALEVVRTKLEKVGLGEFCLELHSHKTSKRQVIEDLKRRLDAPSPHIRDSDANTLLSALETEKASLAACSQLWQTPLGSSGLSIGEAMLAASRWRVDLESFYLERIIPESIDTFRIPNSQDLPQNWLPLALDMATQLARFWRSTGPNNPWFALTNADLTDGDIPRLSRQAHKVADAFENTQSAWNQLAAWAALDYSATAAEIRLWAAHATSLPQPGGKAELRYLATLRDAAVLEQTAAAHAQLELLGTQAASCCAKLGGRTGLDARLTLLQSTVSDVSPALLGATPEQITRRAHVLQGAADAINEHTPALNELARALRANFELSEPFLRDLIALGQFLRSPPQVSAALVGRNLLDGGTHDLLVDAATELEHLESEQNWISQTLRAGVVDILSAQEAAATLANTCWHSWLSPRWHRARSYFKTIWTGPPLPSRERESAALKRYVEAVQRQRALDERQELRAIFGTRTAITRSLCLEALELAGWQRQIHRVTVHRPHLGRSIIEANPDHLAYLSNLAIATSSVLEQAVEALRTFHGLADASSTDVLHNTAREYFRIADTCTQAGVPAAMMLSEAAAAARECRDCLAKEERLQKALERLLGPSAQNTSDAAALGAACELARSLHAWHAPARIRERLFAAKSVEDFQQASVRLNRLEAAFTEASRQLDVFCELLRTRSETWLGTESPDFTCEEVASKARHAATDQTGLRNHLAYVAARARGEAHGLSYLVRWLEDQVIPAQAAEAAVRLTYYRSLLQCSRDAIELVRRFRGMTLDEIRNRYRRLDEELLKLRQAQVASNARLRSIPEGVSSGRVGDLTELALIRHEIGKKKSHIPVRALVQRAARALTALKPCFMMGPLSVPVFLGPDNVTFDVLIFDEASQVRAEHALSAMARGKQMVVVGDSKQLPPTRFFDVIDEDDADGDNISRLEEHESLLAAAKSVLPSQSLRWHYRSRHQSLIQYSNHAFYDNELIVFPSPEGRRETLGVRLVKVAGTFDDRKNVVEAEAIVHSAIAHMKGSPSLSLGVVAMNASQADYIDALMDAARVKDPDVQQYCATWDERNEPFFVKNLENVQGDERDAIFISFTYGPKTVGGAVPQRFGPINQEDGWRRLNVLYTRARSTVTAFTSMGPGDVRADANRRSLLALKGYLEFAASGELPTASVTGRPPDSDFELAVAKALRELGYTVDHQVGVAGYFIDLGVRRSAEDSRYLVGVECDGATYHSAKVARDRDRLRQQILEGYGWQIYRIWSSDWFQDPRGQIEKLHKKLSAL